MSAERLRVALHAALCAGALLAPNAAAAVLRLETVLEKTVLRVDAAYATVDLSARTAERVSSIREGRACDEAMRAELERTLLAADGADFTLEFRRGVGLDQLLASYRANWKRMKRAGLLEQGFDMERETRRQRARFAFLERNGLRSGDRFFYRLRGDTVTIRFVDAHGVERLDQTEVGVFPRRSLLAAYFLKGSELHNGLLRSACR